jgi:hypothetical protein
VLLASDAPVGVVFRRGPSKLTRVVLWNRETDKFTPGQWFKGKIYADRSDISPDGRHMIYFAMGGVARAIPKTGGTWTAISKVPSLTALALWPRGDTWGGGGVFISNNSYWLDTHREAIRDETNLKRVLIRTAPPHTERDCGVRKERYQQGWLFEKELPKSWILRLKNNYRRPRYELHHRERGFILQFPNWEWADWDRNRLVWAEQGCILAARLGTQKLGATKTLCDLNGMTPTEPEYCK